MKDKSNSQNELSRVLEKICEIAEKSADGDYIFRGETKLHKEAPYYRRVSSNLCREYLDDIEAKGFEIELVQKEILDEAKKYSDKKELEILTELQHYGSKTNLIDFTTDYLIALFFACDGSPSEDSRVILQRRNSVESFLQRPREPRNRVMAQKSVFVRPPKGYINPDKVITVESNLKKPMLEYLRNSHSISTETIYNDLHGFIKNQGIHESAYTEFYRGNTCQNKAKTLGSSIEKQEWHNRAIVHYTNALKLKPDLSAVYNNRGIAYLRKGKFDRAIQDYDRAIDLNPNSADIYCNRGEAWLHLREWEKAKADLTVARDKKIDIIASFHNDYESVHDFEKENSVQLPEDIKAMLTQR